MLNACSEDKVEDSVCHATRSSFDLKYVCVDAEDAERTSSD